MAWNRLTWLKGMSSLRKMCPYLEFFWSAFFYIQKLFFTNEATQRTHNQNWILVRCSWKYYELLTKVVCPLSRILSNFDRSYANQWTGFYMTETSVMEELNNFSNFKRIFRNSFLNLFRSVKLNQPGICLFQGNNSNTRTMCEICLLLAMKTL